jgi:heme exporter protein CcmD
VNAAITAAVLAMDDAGYILGSYAVTVAVVAGLAWRIIRRSRQLAAQVDDADKNWT